MADLANTYNAWVDDSGLRLRLPNDVASLTAGQSALRDFLAANGTSARAAYQTELVFEELVANVIHHAYAGRATSAHSIAIEVSAIGDAIRLRVEDDGPPFDPLQAPVPPPPTSLEVARIGGLGLRFIRAAATRIEYERIADRNRVTVWIDNR